MACYHLETPCAIDNLVAYGGVGDAYPAIATREQ